MHLEAGNKAAAGGPLGAIKGAITSSLRGGKKVPAGMSSSSQRGSGVPQRVVVSQRGVAMYGAS